MLDHFEILKYEALYEVGMAAKEAGDNKRARDMFFLAHNLAFKYGDDQRGLDALQPYARALWSLGDYEDAEAVLGNGLHVAERKGITDEVGIITTNLGRIAAVQTVCTVPVNEQKAELTKHAVPKFKQAFDTLRNHPHLYYRFATAQHGSVVAALAGDRRFAGQLLTDGARVAFRSSEEPYDQQPTYRLSRGTKQGMIQMLAAAALIPLGDKTPFLARVARTKLVK